jgi:hypothetical protein
MVRGTRLTLSGLALATSLATTRTALSRPSRDRLLAA